MFGGLASGDPNEQTTQVYLNGEVFESGGIAVAFGGDVALTGIISQGCTPIGDTWTITKAERNLIHEIANRRLESLPKTFTSLLRMNSKGPRQSFSVVLATKNTDDFHGAIFWSASDGSDRSPAPRGGGVSACRPDHQFQAA